MTTAGTDASAKAAPAPKKRRAPALLEGAKLLDMGEFASSLLAAHMYAKVEGARAMTAEQAAEWVREFARLNPVAWHALRRGDLMGVCSQMRRARLDALPANEWAELAAELKG